MFGEGVVVHAILRCGCGDRVLCGCVVRCAVEGAAVQQSRTPNKALYQEYSTLLMHMNNS